MVVVALIRLLEPTLTCQLVFSVHARCFGTSCGRFSHRWYKSTRRRATFTRVSLTYLQLFAGFSGRDKSFTHLSGLCVCVRTLNASQVSRGCGEEFRHGHPRHPPDLRVLLQQQLLPSSGYCFTSCSQAQLLVLLTKILHPNIFRASVSQTLILCYRTGHMLHVCMYIYDIKSIMIIADISDLLLARMMSCLFLAQTILILNWKSQPAVFLQQREYVLLNAP